MKEFMTFDTTTITVQKNNNSRVHMVVNHEYGYTCVKSRTRNGTQENVDPGGTRYNYPERNASTRTYTLIKDPFTDHYDLSCVCVPQISVILGGFRIHSYFLTNICIL